MWLPSGANTALIIRSVWPRRIGSDLASQSHSRTVFSREAVRMRQPSDANTALRTGPMWS